MAEVEQIIDKAKALLQDHLSNNTNIEVSSKRRKIDGDCDSEEMKTPVGEETPIEKCSSKDETSPNKTYNSNHETLNKTDADLKNEAGNGKTLAEEAKARTVEKINTDVNGRIDEHEELSSNERETSSREKTLEKDDGSIEIVSAERNDKMNDHIEMRLDEGQNNGEEKTDKCSNSKTLPNQTSNSKTLTNQTSNSKILTNQTSNSKTLTSNSTTLTNQTSKVRKELENSEILRDLSKLNLRYFSPTEISKLMNFPGSFKFPSECSDRSRYKLLGNSINVRVVAYCICLMLLTPGED